MRSSSLSPAMVGLAVVCAVLMCVSALLWQRLRGQRRHAHIRGFALPKGLYDRLRVKHPALTPKDCQLVAQGLRQFFLSHLLGGRRHVSMPSQVADDLWHEFILYTKHYEVFCRLAFGRFMHHTPAVVLVRHGQVNEGLRRCWRYACQQENINPRKASRLPLLFALDAKLGIAGGFHYVADCSGVGRRDERSAGGSNAYCGADFSDASVDGGLDGLADGGFGGDGGDSGGGGGGDGGGGGCGGGD